MWLADNIASAYMPYLSTTVWYNKPNKSKKVTYKCFFHIRCFHLLLFKSFGKVFMLFMLPIMLVFCSYMNNINVKILFLECSIRVFTIWEKVCLLYRCMHFSNSDCSIRVYWTVLKCIMYFICAGCSVREYRSDFSPSVML